MATDEKEWENIYRRIVKGEYGLDGILQSTHDLNPNGLNIIAVIHDHATACEEYRVIQPLQELEKLGHNCFIMNAGYMQKRLEEKIDDFLGAHLVLFNRMCDTDEVQIVDTARRHGAAVICDYDDDLTNRHRRVHDSMFPKLHTFSAITVATEWLKSVYAGENKHIYILPNLIQRRRFLEWERDIEYPCIGLTGSVTHERDWQVVVNPILHTLERHPDWRCFVSGFMPVELAGHPQVIVPGFVKPEWAQDLLKVPYGRYGWIFEQLKDGVLLIPVDPTDKFNFSKSPLKFREAATAGVACIATGLPLPCYAGDIKNGVNGLLVKHTEEAWESAIETLVSNRELRESIAAHALESSKSYEAHLGAKERLRVYRTVIERDKRRVTRDLHKLL